MKPFATNPIRIAPLVVVTLWLAGCGSLNRAARNGPIPHGESIVFGSISVRAASNWLDHEKITVINTRNSQPVLEHPINGPGGYFYWSLPPGQYAILDLTCTRRELLGNDYESRSRRIYAQFSIDSEQTVAYVGRLALRASSCSVNDDFETAVKTFHAQFPAVNTEPTKHLLHFEDHQ